MKFSICCVTYNDEYIIDAWLNSALEIGDEIVINDGGSTDLTVSIIEKFIKEHPKGDKIKLLHGKELRPDIYENPALDDMGRVLRSGHFGKMRQLAMDNASGEWITFLDADEIFNDNVRTELFKAFDFSKKEDVKAFNVEFVHFIGNLVDVDNTLFYHFANCKIHLNNKDFAYDSLCNHCGVVYKEGKELVKSVTLRGLYVFHFGYARNVFDNNLRYRRNKNFSEIHSLNYLESWKNQHYFDYPVRDFNPSFLPKAIKKRLDIYDL